MTYSLLSKYRSQLMGAAILWVMLFHAQPPVPFAPLNALFRAGFGGVDIFIVLSAVGLVCSLSRRQQDRAAFLSRRAARILPAYFAVMVPYTLYLILSGRAGWSALIWNCTLLYYWVQPRGAFNWYVAGIMGFYASTPWCFARWRRSRHRELLTLGAVLTGLALCQVLTHEGYWQYTDVFFRIPVYFLGLLLGFYVAEDRPLTAKSALFWTGSVLLGAGYFYIHLTRDWIGWPVHFPDCHLFLFTTVPCCLLLALLLDRLPLGLLSRGLDFLGRRSLEIYLLNVSFFSAPAESLFRCVLLFAANIALAAALHRLTAALTPSKEEH